MKPRFVFIDTFKFEGKDTRVTVRKLDELVRQSADAQADQTGAVRLGFRPNKFFQGTLPRVARPPFSQVAREKEERRLT